MTHPIGGDSDVLEEAIPDIRPVPRIAIQAFCESREVAAIIEAASEDRRMSKAHVKVQMGGLGVALEFYHGAPTPNLAVVESRDGRETLLDQLDLLAKVCNPSTKVFVIGHMNDVLLYRELIRRGVSEYIVAPFGIFDFIKSVSELYGSNNVAPPGRTIGFYGSKGGCGSSTISHNVAYAISELFEHKVILADLDLPFGTVGIDFNQDPQLGIGDALLAPERVDGVYLDRLLTKCTERLSLLAAPAMLDRCFELQEASLEPIIDTVSSSVPAVVFDIPHMWMSWTRATLRNLDEIVIVTPPDLAGLRNAKNIVDHLKALRPNDAAPRLLINMNGMPKRPEIKPDEFARALELPTLAVIPFEPQLFGNAANNGQMISEVDAKHAIGETFRTIAQAVMRKVKVRRQKKSSGSSLSFLSRFTRKAAG